MKDDAVHERRDADWMRLHVETLFTSDASGDLLRVNEPGGGPAPRFLLGHTIEGNECWFGPDVSMDLRARLRAHRRVLEAVPVTRPKPHQDELLEILADAGPINQMWAGPTYRFPESIPAPPGCVLVTHENADLLDPWFDEWLGDVGECEPFAVALQDGHAASLCVSVRSTDVAHEAGVETHPDFRQRGLAARAVAFWAAAVRASGIEPLYSTSWENEASQGVARSLGLIPFGHTLHVT